MGRRPSRTAATGVDGSSARTTTTNQPASVRRVSRSSAGRRIPAGTVVVSTSTGSDVSSYSVDFTRDDPVSPPCCLFVGRARFPPRRGSRRLRGDRRSPAGLTRRFPRRLRQSLRCGVWRFDSRHSYVDLSIKTTRSRTVAGDPPDDVWVHTLDASVLPPRSVPSRRPPRKAPIRQHCLSTDCVLYRSPNAFRRVMNSVRFRAISFKADSTARFKLRTPSSRGSYMLRGRTRRTENPCRPTLAVATVPYE